MLSKIPRKLTDVPGATLDMKQTRNKHSPRLLQGQGGSWHVG